MLNNVKSLNEVQQNREDGLICNLFFLSPLGLQQSSEVLKEMTKKMKVLHLDKDQFRLFIHFIFLKPDEVFTSSYQILPYLHSRSSS